MLSLSPEFEMKPTRNRNLFNGDCNVFFYNYKSSDIAPQKKGKSFGAAAVHAYVDRLAKSGVDTFVFNPNAMRPWYPSKVLPTAWEGYKRGDKSYFYGHILGQPMKREQADEYLDGMVKMLDRYLDLVEAGVDWVEETVKACRRNKISPWLSVRMNDMHGGNSYDGSFMNPKLLADPANRLKGHSYNLTEPLNGYRCGM